MHIFPVSRELRLYSHFSSMSCSQQGSLKAFTASLLHIAQRSLVGMSSSVKELQTGRTDQSPSKAVMGEKKFGVKHIATKLTSPAPLPWARAPWLSYLQLGHRRGEMQSASCLSAREGHRCQKTETRNWMMQWRKGRGKFPSQCDDWIITVKCQDVATGLQYKIELYGQLARAAIVEKLLSLSESVRPGRRL